MKSFKTIKFIIFVLIIIALLIPQWRDYKPYRSYEAFYNQKGLRQVFYEGSENKAFVVFENSPEAISWIYLKKGLFGYKLIQSGAYGDQSTLFNKCGFSFAFGKSLDERDHNYYFGAIDKPEITAITLYSPDYIKLGEARLKQQGEKLFWIYDMGNYDDERVIIEATNESQSLIGRVEVRENDLVFGE